MAGHYYSATPIGAGMQNLAAAISGLPNKQAEASLLQAREEEARSRIMGHEAQRQLHVQQMQNLVQAYRGRENLAGRFRTPTAPAAPAAPAAPEAPLAPPTEGVMASAIAPLAPVNATPLPGLTSAAGVPSAVSTALPDPVAPAVVGRPVAPAVAAAPALPGVPGGGTGMDPVLVRNIVADAILANEDNIANYLRAYGGGQLAAGETDPIKAFSFLQGGAGQGYDSTFAGGQAKQQETARQHDLEDSRHRYDTDVRANTAARGQDVRAGATVQAAGLRGGGKGGAAPKGLTKVELESARGGLALRLKKAGMAATEADNQAYLDRVDQYKLGGKSLQEAQSQAFNDLFDETPAHTEPGKLWGTNDVPVSVKRRENVAALPPRTSPVAGAVTGPGAAGGPTNDTERAMAAEIAALPVIELDKWQADVEQALASGRLSPQDRQTANQVLAQIQQRRAAGQTTMGPGRGGAASAAPAAPAAPAARPAPAFAPAAGQGAPAAAAVPVPKDKTQRVKGKVYVNDQGRKAEWTGTGWKPVN